MNKTEELEKLKRELEELRESPLYEYRIKNQYQPVVGEGPENAKIMLIGEAPGLNEAKTGKVFCGASGKFLDVMLAQASIKRNEIYIGSIVKDRPPDNRDPTSKEVELYGPFTLKQINIIQPKIIATLGRHSTVYLMKEFGLSDKLNSISKIHGNNFKVATQYGEAIIVPLFHPAAALYNPKLREIMIEDFKKLPLFAL